MGRQVLVTGGTGYIGSHTVVELLQKDYEVFIIDNLSNSHISVLDGIEKISGKKPHFTKLDLTDKFATEKYFNNHHDLDAVIHFAALKSVNESVAEPLRYYKNNLESLINLLHNMITKEISSLVNNVNKLFKRKAQIEAEEEQKKIDAALAAQAPEKVVKEQDRINSYPSIS